MRQLWSRLLCWFWEFVIRLFMSWGVIDNLKLSKKKPVKRLLLFYADSEKVCSNMYCKSIWLWFSQLNIFLDYFKISNFKVLLSLYYLIRTIWRLTATIPIKFIHRGFTFPLCCREPFPYQILSKDVGVWTRNIIWIVLREYLKVEHHFELSTKLVFRTDKTCD